MPSATSWLPLHPSKSIALIDSRLQFHHAAQFATALGISFLPRKADDSHTNLGWEPRHEALCSRPVDGPHGLVQAAVRPRDLTLLVVVDGAINQQIPLHGLTASQAESALGDAISAAGLERRHLTMKRHFDLPAHPVSNGEPFNSGASDDFAQLASWYGNAADLLDELRSRTDGDEVRCWPHHFDIATLATIAPGRSSGAGMLPGDEQISEPYFYVNAYPPPPPERATATLRGGGEWNTDGWFGAVLRGSHLSTDPAAQPVQIRSFLDSASDACASLLRS